MTAAPEQHQEVQEPVSDYLTVSRSLGYKLDAAEYILRRFVAYLHDLDAPQLLACVPR